MQCERCGRAVSDSATVCGRCAEAAEPPPMPSPDDFVGQMIPTGNKPSLIGYYCAFGGFLPVVGPVLAVVAVVFGVKGVRLARRHPEVRGGCHAWFAIVAGVFIGLIGVAATFALVLGVSEALKRR